MENVPLLSKHKATKNHYRNVSCNFCPNNCGGSKACSSYCSSQKYFQKALNLISINVICIQYPILDSRHGIDKIVNFLDLYDN